MILTVEERKDGKFELLTADYADFTDVSDSVYPRHPWLTVSFERGSWLIQKSPLRSVAFPSGHDGDFQQKVTRETKMVGRGETASGTVLTFFGLVALYYFSV